MAQYQPAPRRAPHSLSNDSANYVAMKGAESIFLVEAIPWHLDDGREPTPGFKRDCKNMYNELADQVQLQTEEAKDGTGSSKRPREASSSQSKNKQKGISIRADETSKNKQKGVSMGITAGTKERYSTGFAIARDSPSGERLRILTCAHIFEDLYKKGMHTLTKENIEKMFKISVICVHQQREVLARDSPLPPSRRLKQPTLATVFAVDTEKDLLVLEINIGYLCLFSGTQPTEYCMFDNPPICVAPRPPQIREEVVLLGWPPQRSESSSSGNVSFPNRTYDMVCDLEFNMKGYTMTLMEIDKLLCAHGYSGGPVLNTVVQLVGTYHGIIEKKGYSVSLEDINQFLTQFGVMTHWPDE
uniref:Peptidase S1 domain-containing protein n=1 Tax=Leersia perrieri TaxID=77586 RepID=A0A0D9WD44_9ORYZ